MSKVGILLLNTGSPASCAPKDVKRYLTSFLMDGRVLDVPFWLREILVKWLIVPFRYKKSARAYAKIWTPEGSPLLKHSLTLAQKLEEALNVQVAVGLSYSRPSIQEAVESLKNCNKIIALPLFPQYASATGGSCIEELMRCVSRWQVIPELEIRGPMAHDERFLQAWCESAAEIDFSSYDYILFSFHGLPIRQIKKQDRAGCCLKRNCCTKLTNENAYCYSAQCLHTAKELAQRLQIYKYGISFQSRLGMDRWLGPYTQDVIKERARLGDKKVLVFAPSFVADCLETLYEIGMEYREEFLMLGGQVLDLVPSLNTHPAWVSAVAEMVMGQSLLSTVRTI